MWERSNGDSSIAYEAFRRFRDAGPHRSLAGARSIERRWSWRWSWAARAGAWDDERWRRADEATLLGARGGSAVERDVDALSAVAGHLGDTVETVSRTYVHWLRDDREVPAAVLSRMLRPSLKVVESV